MTNVARAIMLLVVTTMAAGCGSSTSPASPSASRAPGSPPIGSNGSTADSDKNHRKSPDNDVEIEGPLMDIDRAAQMLTVASTVVSVPSGTPIRHGDSRLQFTDLKI